MLLLYSFLIRFKSICCVRNVNLQIFEVFCHMWGSKLVLPKPKTAVFTFTTDTITRKLSKVQCWWRKKRKNNTKKWNIKLSISILSSLSLCAMCVVSVFIQFLFCFVCLFIDILHSLFRPIFIVDVLFVIESNHLILHEVSLAVINHPTKISLNFYHVNKTKIFNPSRLRSFSIWEVENDIYWVFQNLN